MSALRWRRPPGQVLASFLYSYLLDPNVHSVPITPIADVRMHALCLCLPRRYRKIPRSWPETSREDLFNKMAEKNRFKSLLNLLLKTLKGRSKSPRWRHQSLCRCRGASSSHPLAQRAGGPPHLKQPDNCLWLAPHRFLFLSFPL